MRSFWLFRTNLRPLEYYHSIKDLETFKSVCHDFYVLMGIWFFENNKFDEVVVWRLKPKGGFSDIIFDVSGKKFIQRFVDNFNECFKYKPSTVSFFRGGFPEYDELIKKDPKFFGMKLYLGAGHRTYPQYGGKYNKILVESQRDLSKKTIPFYKTANLEIFKPLSLQKKYDVCWICNFTQIKQKGQEFFISEVSKSNFLKSLSICHVGNNPQTGVDLCRKYNVSNIRFLGSLDRPFLNKFLNESKFGLVTSNSKDGCPRVITEVLTSGTPLIIRSETKVLDYFKRNGVIEFKDDEIEKQFKKAFDFHGLLKSFGDNMNDELLSMKTICEKNLEVWL